jgi:predicted esterase
MVWPRVIALAVLALPAFAAEFEIKLPQCEDAVLVSLPDNHEPGSLWPGVFCYHGLNGRPRTDWFRSHTGPDDWIVVAMPYVQRGHYEVTAAALKRELAALHAVRDQLVASRGLDPEQVYLAGLSKGGWMVDHLLQVDRSVAGGAILMAGHLRDLPADPQPYREGTPVFIGIGRKDGNYPFALRALLFHRQLGARVEMESWPELAHAVPQDGSPGLREWFALRAGRQPDAAALDREFSEILDLDRVERWWRLTRFKQRPAVAAEGSRWGAKTDEALAAIRDDPAVAREAALHLDHRRLLAREIKGRTVPEMEQVLHDYLQLIGRAEGSFQEDLVAIDLARVRKVMQNVATRRAEQPARPATREEVKPDFPDDRRRIPGNPLVR